MTSTDIPPSRFWNSPFANKVIARAAAGMWDTPTGVVPWRRMLQVMERNNNPDEKDEILTTVFCLWQFVDLFKAYGLRLRRRFGRNWSDLVRVEFENDHLSLAFFQLFREILAINRDRAFSTLFDIKRKGLPYKRPGGLAGTYRSKDFGVELLIHLTGRIDSALARRRKQDNEATKITDVAARKTMKQVQIDWNRGNRATLRYGATTCELTVKESQFILKLHAEKGPVRFDDLWTLIYPSERYQLEKKAPPAKLRSLKRALVRRLGNAFGLAPNNEDWIGRNEGFGYLLNQSVKWQFKKGAKDTISEHLHPSGDLGNMLEHSDRGFESRVNFT